MKNRSATSLTELLLVLTLLGILFTLAMPHARHGLDAMRVRSARESTVGAALRARSLAVAHGGADLVLDLSAETASAVDGNGVLAEQTALSQYDVRISADGTSSSRIVLRYDALGIGRMASRTIRFRRGRAEAGLTFSSYGRIRRW